MSIPTNRTPTLPPDKAGHMPRTGFLEEAPGVHSSARLAALLAIGATFAIGLAAAAGFLRVVIAPQSCHLAPVEMPAGWTQEIAAQLKDVRREICVNRDITGMLASVSAIIGALGASAWGALRERNPESTT